MSTATTTPPLSRSLLHKTTSAGALPSPVPAHALVKRPAAERGVFDHGWLRSAHSFSFGQYYDPRFKSYHALRVINDDWIDAGRGFPTHPHRDFEIFSYVLEGAISHKDSTGNGSTVNAGEVQLMSAGSGIKHSEFNPSSIHPMRLLQVWLIPAVRGAPPRYNTRSLSCEEKAGKLALFIAEDGREGAIQTLAPADVYAGTFKEGEATEFVLAPGRCGWVQVARGHLHVGGVELSQGDGLAINAPGRLTFSGGQNAEVLFFDLEDQKNR
ncbi:MAG: pirin family protein [Pseudomonadota bacterium]